MRQVGRAELVWRFKYRLGRLSATLRNSLASKHHDARRRAEQMLAEQLVDDGLDRYEILSSAPLPPDTDLFTAAAYGTGSGQAPRIGVADE